MDMLWNHFRIECIFASFCARLVDAAAAAAAIRHSNAPRVRGLSQKEEGTGGGKDISDQDDQLAST